MSPIAPMLQPVLQPPAGTCRFPSPKVGRPRQAPTSSRHSTETSFTAPNANSAATSAAATSASRVICALICEYGSCEPRRASAGGCAPKGLNTVYTTVPAWHILSGLALPTGRSACAALLHTLLLNTSCRAGTYKCAWPGRLSAHATYTGQDCVSINNWSCQSSQHDLLKPCAHLSSAINGGFHR